MVSSDTVAKEITRIFSTTPLGKYHPEGKYETKYWCTVMKNEMS